MELVYINDPGVLRNIYMTLVTNSDITSTIPQLTQFIDEFREIFPNLQNSKDMQKKSDNLSKPENYTNNFYFLLDKIILAINEYAAMSENAELLSYVSFNKENPVVPGNSDFNKNAQLVLYYANRYSSAIERFGVKKHHLIEFELEINSCTKYNRMNEKELSEKLRTLLIKIDHLVEGLKDKFPRFYSEYQMSKLSRVKNHSYENISVW